MTGRVFDIQRFCLHDGPGIRTTVFLKGCFLHCLWCHNPESISPQPQLSYLPLSCVSCGECYGVCPSKALSKGPDGKPVLDRKACIACGKCSDSCDVHALQMVGRDAGVESVMDVVMRDRDYYATSGGGMTLSGGEPMFQPGFALALLQAAKANGLHTCVETAGTAEWKEYERVAPLVDLFLYDWKETDPQLHESFTGKTNALIRENLRRLHDAGSAILLRCPMIPEFNARKEHTAGIAAIARELPRLKGVELLPYHRLGRSKLDRFGFATRMPSSVKPPEPRVFAEWLALVRNGAPSARVFSGTVTSSQPE